MNPTPSLIVYGLGSIGKRVCEIAMRNKIVRISGVADSSGFRRVKDDDDLRRALQEKSAGKKLVSSPSSSTSIDAMVHSLKSEEILADCSAANEAGEVLAKIIAEAKKNKRPSPKIVMANKKPLSSSVDIFEAITQNKNSRFEATVGAGLPVICTARRMFTSGDEIEEIQGQFSGTLGYILSRLEDEGVTFSQAVGEAEKFGYTEPDPRDDLGGVDVGRKALILARYAMKTPKLTMADVVVEPLFPKAFAALTVPEFRSRLTELNAEWKAKVADAKKRDSVLRYAAKITRESPSSVKVKVGVVEAKRGESALASLRGTLNLVSFQSKFYPKGRETVVTGPGAGVDVTASGVLGDVAELFPVVTSRMGNKPSTTSSDHLPTTTSTSFSTAADVAVTLPSVKHPPPDSTWVFDATFCDKSATRVPSSPDDFDSLTRLEFEEMLLDFGAKQPGGEGWVDFDGAAYLLGVVLEVFPEDSFMRFKWVFWTSNPLNEKLVNLLNALSRPEEACLESRTQPDFQFRRKAVPV